MSHPYLVNESTVSTFTHSIYTSFNQCVSLISYILGKEEHPYLDSTPLVFKNNFAGIRGSALYAIEACVARNSRHLH